MGSAGGPVPLRWLSVGFNPFRRMSSGDIVVHLIVSVLMVLVVIVTLYPFYYIEYGLAQLGE